MIKAIIFDFDGVILNSEPIHWQACNMVFEKIGFTIPYDYYLQHYAGVADKEMFPRIFTENCLNYTPPEIDDFIVQKVQAFKTVINSSKELKGIDGLPQFLNFANQAVPNIAICSGAIRTEIETILAKIENGTLQQYFKHITTSEDVSKGKPSPEGYLKTAVKLNVLPEDCLVIEDTQIGIQAARAANMKVIGITTTNRREVLSEAHAIIDAYEGVALEDLIFA